MAFPTEPTEPITEIATDTNYNVPGEDWDGQPTKVAPTTAIEEQGYVPGTPRPADVDNWLFNMIAKWLTYLVAFGVELRDTYLAGLGSSTDNRIVLFSGTTGKAIKQSVASIGSSGIFETAATGGYRFSSAVTRDIPLSPNRWVVESGDAHTRSLVSAGSFLTCATDSMEVRMDITDLLQPGMTLKSAEIACTPGDTRTAPNAVSLRVFKRLAGLMSGTATQVGSTDYDDGTAVAQTLEVTGLTDVFDPLYHYTLVVKAGNNTSTSFDVIGGGSLTVEQTQVW